MVIEASEWSTLVAKFFHEVGKDGYADRQGVIISEPYPRIFFIRYFDWLMGEPAWNLRLVTLDDILRGQYRFYASNEQMREAYEHGGLARPVVNVK